MMSVTTAMYVPDSGHRGLGGPRTHSTHDAIALGWELQPHHAVDTLTALETHLAPSRRPAGPRRGGVRRSQALMPSTASRRFDDGRRPPAATQALEIIRCLPRREGDDPRRAHGGLTPQ